MTTNQFVDIEEALQRRDLRSVCWYVMASLLRSPGDPPKFAAPAASIARVILALGEESSERAEILEETAVIGSVLHGLAPETVEQWAIAERLYGAPTLRQLRQWDRRRSAASSGERSVQSDTGDVLEPLLLWNGGAGEEDVAGFIDDEDGG